MEAVEAARAPQGVVLDVGINVAFNYATTGELNVGGALKESALGLFNPRRHWRRPESSLRSSSRALRRRLGVTKLKSLKKSMRIPERDSGFPSGRKGLPNGCVAPDISTILVGT